MSEQPKTDVREDGVTRRQFVKGLGAVSATAVFGGTILGGLLFPNGVMAIPASTGYLLVDMKKCQGCNTCMMACSLAHHGEQNLSLSRIQIVQDSWKGYPDDIGIEACRQCKDPKCVEACPTGAMHADADTGEVRLVDADKCIGCMQCVEACPHGSGRVIWNHEEGHAQKCDLCANTPFWDHKGGPGGTQACISVCPVNAIKYTDTLPGDDGYEVNLRGKGWAAIGLSTD